MFRVNSLPPATMLNGLELIGWISWISSERASNPRRLGARLPGTWDTKPRASWWYKLCSLFFLSFSIMSQPGPPPRWRNCPRRGQPVAGEYKHPCVFFKRVKVSVDYQMILSVKVFISWADSFSLRLEQYPILFLKPFKRGSKMYFRLVVYISGKRRVTPFQKAKIIK